MPVPVKPTGATRSFDYIRQHVPGNGIEGKRRRSKIVARSKYARPRAQAYDPVVRLVEHVTLLRAENIVLHIRFKGGATCYRRLTGHAWPKLMNLPEPE